MDRGLLEAWLAEDLSLEQIGARVGRHPSTVSYWLKKYELSAVHAVRHAARGGLDRRVLAEYVHAGASVALMAAELNVSESTVKHWLRKFGMQTNRGARLAEARTARAAGKREIQRTCSRHGRTDFVLESRGSYRCSRCRSDAVADRRRAVKEILVREAGGRCRLCGYDRYVGALQFHHLDRTAKAFSLSDQGISRSLDKAREEAQKCVVLCSRCHAEVEAGIVQVVAYNDGRIPG